MSIRSIFYAYVLGGLTFIPLCLFACFCIIVHTSIPVGHEKDSNETKATIADSSSEDDNPPSYADATQRAHMQDLRDQHKARRSWLTVRRTYEEQPTEGNDVSLVRNFID